MNYLNLTHQYLYICLQYSLFSILLPCGILKFDRRFIYTTPLFFTRFGWKLVWIIFCRVQPRKKKTGPGAWSMHNKNIHTLFPLPNFQSYPLSWHFKYNYYLLYWIQCAGNMLSVTPWLDNNFDTCFIRIYL